MNNRHARSRRTVGLAAATAITLLTVAACSGAAATPVPATPPPAATAAAMQVMGTGSFHDVDGAATGKVELVVLPDGTYEVIFEDFSAASIDHTNVVLVSNADVTATADVDKAKLLDLGPLKSTEGMQEYKIPADMAATMMEDYHTVVIWDTQMAHATAAAPLK